MNKKSRNLPGIVTMLTLAVLGGCTDGTGDPISAGPNHLNAAGSGGVSGSGGNGGAPEPVVASKKMDLLFVVDNSSSMKDKQIQLANVAPELLTRLVNPRCVDQSGVQVAQPSTPQEPCPAGSTREFDPVADLHIGVISSSLGSHGGDYCTDVDREDPDQDFRKNFTQNDRGRLLNRGLRKDESKVDFPTEPTYNGLGFLVWDPAGAGSPPGEKDIAQVAQGVRNLVLGADQIGCGYEAPLEA
ncbi:MAG: hypothetical protein RMJ98_15605 [Myxococcales bacterium]|nr:hypothetical protein [Polyangiaceae bacterium]MDW8250721.1 hypothetical protein [Myxococcales bacterium]